MANNLIAVTSTDLSVGNYLLSKTGFKYLILNSEIQTRIKTGIVNLSDIVQQDIDTLIPLAGLDLVKMTDRESGLVIAVNRLAMHKFSERSDGAGTVHFFDGEVRHSVEPYSVLAPLFTAVPSGGGGGGGPVLVDGVTVVGNGDTIPLSVGQVNTVNIVDQAVQFPKIQHINSQRLLGRHDAGVGVVQEILLGTGLVLTGSSLEVSGVVVNTDGVIIIGDGAGSPITIANDSIPSTKYAPDSVIFSKMQNIASQVLLGRYSPATGDIEIITIGSGLNLSAGGELTATLPAINVDGVTILGDGAGTPLSVGVIATANIGTQQVTYDRIQNVTGDRLLGRFSLVDGSAQEIQLGPGLSIQTGQLTGANLPSLADQATIGGDGSSVPSAFHVLDLGISTAKLQDGAVTFAKLQNISQNVLLGRRSSSAGAVEEIIIGTGLVMVGNTLTASGGGSGGEANTMSNEGGQIGWFINKDGVNFRMKTFAADAPLTLDQTDPNVVRIQFTGTPVSGGANIGTGVGVFSAINANVMELRSIDGLGAISVAQNGDTIEISGGGENNTGSNQGGGVAEIYIGNTGPVLDFRSISPGVGISVSQNGDRIDIAAALSAVLNGLSLDGSTVVLGGNMDRNTTINGLSTFNFLFSALADFQVNTATMSLIASGNALIQGNDLTHTANGNLALNATSGAINGNATDITMAATNDLNIGGTNEVNVNSDTVRLGNAGGSATVSIGDQYDMPGAAPAVPTNGDIKMVQWRNNSGTVVPEFVDPPSGGGGGGSTYHTVDVSGIPEIRSVVVKATGSGCTFNRINSNTWEVVVPDGVDLDGGTIFAETSGNPGNSLKLRFTFNGNGSDGTTRKANTNKDNIDPPEVSVVNRSVDGLGGPTDALPMAYHKLSGSSLLELFVTGAPGVGAATYLQITANNYNSNAVGGGSETSLSFKF